MPPQGSPTSKASSSAYPYVAMRAEAPCSTSSACWYTAGSTHPPVTEPTTSPVSDTAMTLPGSRGADRSTVTTVAIAARCPSWIQRWSVGRTSLKGDLGVVPGG